MLGGGTLGQSQLIQGLTDSVKTGTEADPSEFGLRQSQVLGTLKGWVGSGLDL